MKIFLLFVAGGIIFPCLELLWRRRTHVSMIFAGGISMLALYWIFLIFPALHIVFKSIISALFITVLELVIGIVVNLIMRLNVWDYSKLRFNLLGQICPLFTAIWFGLSLIMLNMLSIAHSLLNVLLTANV